MHILEAEFLTNDLLGTISFYKETLGFTLLKRGPTSAHFGVGSSILGFVQSKIRGPRYHFAFHVPVNQLEEALEWSRQRTLIIHLPDHSAIAEFTSWRARAFYFFDNNGNILEFICREPLGIVNNNAFSPFSVTGLSEVAIVCGNVERTASRIQKQTGIGVFLRQPPHHNFTALGDDRGLLILSLQNRPWFPTEIPSEKFRVKVRLLNDLGQEFRLSVNR